ncbi:MAG: hypothetical protein WDN06_14415 [Asticcacaulis sp.]
MVTDSTSTQSPVFRPRSAMSAALRKTTSRRPKNAAITVVMAIDGSVVLVVAAQGGQGQDVGVAAGLRRIEAGENAEFRLARFRVPAPLGRPYG